MAEENKKPKVKKSTRYDVTDGTVKRKNRFCPKCGEGVFMAEHKDRFACGKCGFSEKKN